MANRKMAVLSALLVCQLSAACRGRQPPPPPPSATPETLAWVPIGASERLYTDNTGGVQDRSRVVIRDDAAYRDAWLQATSRHASPPAPPAVDFAREMVLLVSGGRMTAEDLIRVDSVVVQNIRTPAGALDEALAVVVRVVEGCGNVDIDAYPLQIVRVRRFDGEVRWLERRDRAEGCRGAEGPPADG